MKNFKELRKEVKKNDEPLVFGCAGGPEGLYDKFNIDHNDNENKEKKDDIKENLNPRDDTIELHQHNRIFHDPEKNNEGLGDEEHSPENIGIPDIHGSTHVYPSFNKEHASHIKALLRNTDDENPQYHDIVTPYTQNSYNLNQTLFKHHKLGTKPPRHIKANLDHDYDEDDDDPSMIDTHHMDELIRHHKLPHSMTVYSGLHFDPRDHKGKIVRFPAYTSTSISPHVAKDFGIERYKNNTHEKHILRLQLPKGQHHLFTDNGSSVPGQGELILPRGIRMQLGHKPTHSIHGSFDSSFGHNPKKNHLIHIWNGRIIPDKDT